jgi:hypothetical protein
MEREAATKSLSDEEFTDLMEEGLRQASRSTTDDRRKHIANVIANSLAPEKISFVESRHLLRLLAEINDIEVIWLRSYLNPVFGSDAEFRSKNKAVLEPIAANIGSPQEEHDKVTLQNSYKEHLCQLGLLDKRYRMNSRTKAVELDSRTGQPKLAGYEITRLGRLLLQQINAM